MGLIHTGYVYVIDWGGYDHTLPAQQLWDAGVRVLIVKGGQPGTKKLIAAFRAVGFVVGCFYWDDPTVDVTLQLKYHIGLIQDEGPDFIALDIEQYWADWAEWNQWLKDRTPMTQFFTGRQISDHARAARNGLKVAFPGKFYLNYTADWFIRSWSMELISWLYEDPAWYASAFDSGMEWYEITWDHILKTPGDAQPILPPGAPGWKMWQYSSRMVAPGMQFPFDWNIFKGAIEELKGEAVPPEPNPVFLEYEVEVTSYYLTVCCVPSATFPSGKWLKGGDKLQILEETAGWGRYSDGWVNLAYTKKVVTSPPIELNDHEMILKLWALHAAELSSVK